MLPSKINFQVLLIGLTIGVNLPLSAVEPPSGWKPKNLRLETPWTSKVTPDKPWNHYPRPQLQRTNWVNLNGLWEYAITPEESVAPKTYQGKILVPYPVESALSGVSRRVGKTKALWYRTHIQASIPENDDRLLLHFGAVDWECQAWLNGKKLGTHRGGYDPFTFDLTEHLSSESRQELILRVWDPTDQGFQPRGKQREKPKGIWYTPVTGIWQTVWLETVPQTSIQDLKLTPDLDRESLEINLTARGDLDGLTFTAESEVHGNKVSVLGVVGQLSYLNLKGQSTWSPESPNLHKLIVTLYRSGKPLDRIESYYGLRKISLGKDQNGITRLFLNNKPYFQYGPLDQGYWPDGLYTPPTEQAMLHDLKVTKQMGFNMVRKHVKVECARWYYACDQMGLLVWQDLPNGDRHARWPLDGTERERTEESVENFKIELLQMMRSFHNSPSIVVWVPFNEAWGQFSTDEILKIAENEDPSRLIDCPSGGNDFGTGHIKDIHDYPGPKAPPAELYRAGVLGEYGGLGLPLKGHTWQDEKNWGYRSCKDKASLQEAYEDLIRKLVPFAKSRLAGAIYTQTTDVEIEINGLMTYDRKVIKFDVERFKKVSQQLYSPIQKLSANEVAKAWTLVHWNFDEGNDNPALLKSTTYLHGDGKSETPAVSDRTGHKNHLWVYNERTAPRYSKEVSAPIIPQTGRKNLGSLDDSRTGPAGTPTMDLYTEPGKSHTHMNILNTAPLKDWTLEVSFKLSELGKDHGLIGKDGKPTEGPFAPLQLRVKKNNKLSFEAFDETKTLRKIESKESLQVNVWYHAAITSDGNKVSLYLKQHGLRQNSKETYTLQNQSQFSGRWLLGPGTWTVGRGFHDGKIGWDAKAWFDEIRISTKALSPELFLFSDR